MQMPELLAEDRRVELLKPLLDAGWTETDDGTAIRKEFTFKSFGHAFAWMTRVAMLAERLNHHPEWSNIYNRVAVMLTTHSAGGLTDLDLRMAQSMDRFQ